MTDVLMKMPNARISGPVAGYSIIYKGKKYYFFSDIHRSLKGKCPPPCDPIANCFDITTLLINIFETANQKGEWVDFYLEVPFISRSRLYHPREYYSSNTTDVIHQIYVEFWNCFTKQDCPFATTRFHYIDIRNTYRPGKSPKTETPGIGLDSTSYFWYLNNRMKTSVDLINTMYSTGSVQSYDYIETTTTLVNDFLGPQKSGETKGDRLFKLYLQSDNFPREVGMLFKQTLQKLKEGAKPIKLIKIIKRYMFPQDITVNRDGKSMHKIRAQLFQLHREQPQLAEDIKNFCLAKYAELKDRFDIFRLWNNMMESYRSLIGIQLVAEKNYIIRDIHDKYNAISNIMTSQGGLLVDAYTLARLFRNFSPQSNKHVIYAGHLHISNYKEFFSHLPGNQIIEYNPNEEALKYLTTTSLSEVSRCIEIDINDFD